MCRLFFFPKFLTDIRFPGISENLSPLATVIRHPGFSIRKSDNRSFAMIGTERTREVGFLRVGKIIHGIQADKGFLCLPCAKTLLREQSHTDSSHDSRVRRPNNFFSYILLHSPQYRIILKSAALNHDFIAKGIQIGNTDNFSKYIFYNGTAKSGHNIRR